MNFLAIFVISIVLIGLEGASVFKSRDEDDTHDRIVREASDVDIDSYLEKYGYLPKTTGTEIGGFLDEATRVQAIKDFQRFSGLAVNGEVNEETITKMQQRRCGVPDIPRTDDTTDSPIEFHAPGYKWDKNTITWKSTRDSSKLPLNVQRTAIENAFKYWSDVTPLQFRHTDGKPDIEIVFARGDHGDGRYNAFDGQGKVLAHAYYPKNGDTHFDEDESWVHNSDEGTDLQTVAAHEFGHALGLGHSNIPDSLMAPFYKGYQADMTLHADDISGIQSLYGKRTAQPSTTAAPTPSPTDTTTATTTTTKSITTQGTVDCDMKFDAIALGPDGYTYAFREANVYKLNDHGLENGPIPTQDVYPGAPINIGAAVYIKDTKQTYMFKGKRIWRYTGFTLDAGYPKTVNESRVLFPRRPHAALTFNLMGSERIFIFSGEYFWEFNRHTEEISPSYKQPMPISLYWNQGIRHAESAIQWKDSYLYVFKGLKYRKVHPVSMRLLDGYPKTKAPAWLGGACGSAPK